MTAVVIQVGTPDVNIITGGQGPPGPPGVPGPGGASDSVIVIQTDSTLVPGTPVYVTGVSTVNIAIGSAIPDTRVAGLSMFATAATFAATIQTQDIITLTTTEWDGVTGESGGLTPGGVYYLSTATAGMLTQTPAIANPPLARYNVRVGRALSTVKMDVQIRPPIKL